MQYQFNEAQHLHTLEGKPLTGTSSVMSVIAKPLTWWASGLAVGELGWLNPKKHAPEARKIALEAGLASLQGISVEDYDKRLTKAYRAHADNLKDTADTGTDMHAELEKYVKLMIKDQAGVPHELSEYDHKAVETFAKWAVENVKKFIWSEAHCYSEKFWLGGITDCGAEMKNGEMAIIDFKSSKEAYPSQFWQIAGYDLQISENGLFSFDGKHNKKIDKPFTQHIIVPFGAENPIPVISREVESGKRAFLAALEIYRQLAVLEKQ